MQFRIIPCYCALTLPIIKIVAFILQYRLLRKYRKTVRKTPWNKKLEVIAFRKPYSDMPAECRGTAPYVYSHIEHLSPYDSDKF